MSIFDTASLIITPNGTKAGKLYSVVPSSGAGDMTVTRATSATRVNSAGLIESVASNVPRLDYSNGSCPSILVEPQRTNLFSYSEEFDNAYWLKYQASVTPNTIVTPDGTTTADNVTVTTGSGGAVYLVSSLTGTYTVSIFIKAGTSSVSVIEVAGVGNIDFNLVAGTFTTSGSVTGTIKSFGNGWYRCTSTFTGTSVPYISFGVTGTAGQNIYLWGAQLEAGSYATSYIPTTSASVTRNADVISKTGISSLIGQTEGTLLFDFVFKTPPSTTDGQVAISSTSASDRVIIWNNFTLNTLALQIRANNVNVVSNISLGIFVDGTRYKIAIAYESGNTSAYVNGTQIISNTSNFTFSSLVADFILGAYEINYQGHQFSNTSALWKTRLTNAELATLTNL